MLGNFVKSYLMGFFIAGAVIFPLLNPYYGMRVLLTLGVFGVGYGVQSVLKFGHISTSGMLSGHDSGHDVMIYGILLSIACFVWLARRDKARVDRSI
ncbi:MAG: hypothetical protein ABW136_05420 [Steroidobacteraceae bacterium]